MTDDDFLQRLSAAGAVTGLDISPDGRRMVFGSTASGMPQIYVQSLEGGDPVQLTRDGESSVQPCWSPRGDLIAFLQDVGGDENLQIYVMSPDGGPARNLTDLPGKLHSTHAFSPDGSRIAFISNRDGQFDVYVVDVESAEIRLVTNHPSVHFGPQFSPDGKRISFASNRTDLASNWDTFVIDLESGAERKLTDHQGEADEMSYYAGQSPLWSPDGRRILVGSSVPGNYDIMAIDVDKLNREWLATSAWDESNAQWSPKGDHIAYVVNEDGNLIIHVKELATGRSWPVSQPTGCAGDGGGRSSNHGFRWTPDGSHLIYSYSSSTVPGGIWKVSAQGKERVCLYSACSPDFPSDKLAPAELIHYQSFDGRQISAFLYRPANASGPVPAVIIPHGGPTGQSQNLWSPYLGPLCQDLVRRGYAVLEPNFRGSTGYGTEFQWLNRYDWGGGDLEDVMAGTHWLESEGISDRFGICGGSYGGFMTMTAITKRPERWEAAVSIFGIVNLFTSYESSREDMKQFQIRNLGTPEENHDLYVERSPINFMDNIQCPLLILQGDRDSRVRPDEALQMRKSLESNGKVHEFVMYENEGHGFAHPENRLDSIRRTADFFDKYLAKKGALAAS